MTDAITTNDTVLVAGGGISDMTAAPEAAECGGNAKDAGLDGQVIRAKKLEEIAVKVVNK